MLINKRRDLKNWGILMRWNIVGGKNTVINTTSWINVKMLNWAKEIWYQKRTYRMILLKRSSVKKTGESHLWWQKFAVWFGGCADRKVLSRRLASASWSTMLYFLIQAVTTQVDAYVRSLRNSMCYYMCICILSFDKIHKILSLDNINMKTSTRGGTKDFRECSIVIGVESAESKIFH